MKIDDFAQTGMGMRHTAHKSKLSVLFLEE